MAIPDSMTFIMADGPGGPDVLKPAHGPTPKPAADEVLIRVQAAGVNRPDVAQRQGPLSAAARRQPGARPGGRRRGRGGRRRGARTTRSGDRVCALTNGGGYAEYCVGTAAADACRGRTATTRSAPPALPETYFTVWANLFMLGRLARGESALVHGGTSGIGVTAIQLAQAFGATVYATAGSRREGRAPA